MSCRTCPSGLAPFSDGPLHGTSFITPSASAYPSAAVKGSASICSIASGSMVIRYIYRLASRAARRCSISSCDTAPGGGSPVARIRSALASIARHVS